MSAADFGDRLADSVFGVVHHAGAELGDDAAIGGFADVARFQLLYISGQQVNAVRIDAAQIGGYQRGGHQARFGLGHAAGSQNGLGESGQGFGVDQNEWIRHSYFASEAEIIS